MRDRLLAALLLVSLGALLGSQLQMQQPRQSIVPFTKAPSTPPQSLAVAPPQRRGPSLTLPRQRVLAVLGVHSGPGNVERRKKIRATWASDAVRGAGARPCALMLSGQLVLCFVIGSTDNSALEAALQREAAQHGDILRVGVGDSYTRMTHKVVAFYERVLAGWSADYLAKIDDVHNDAACDYLTAIPAINTARTRMSTCDRPPCRHSCGCSAPRRPCARCNISAA